jgi:hypothetical protein
MAVLANRKSSKEQECHLKGGRERPTFLVCARRMECDAQFGDGVIGAVARSRALR